MFHSETPAIAIKTIAQQAFTELSRSPCCNCCKVCVNTAFTSFASTRDIRVVIPATTVESETKSYTQDARWLLARRIARSSTFSRSEQLPKLLLYVCKMTISEREEEINEQRIGVDVYGRSPNYDPSVDGIVRSHATRLRQKLELYFRSEGIHEPMKIEIPRGGYVPRFYTLENEVSPSVETLATKVEEEKPTAPAPVKPAAPVPAFNKDQTRRSWIVPFFCGLILACGLIMAILHLRHDAAIASTRYLIPQTEIERQFWNKLFPQNGRTLIVSGDSGLVLYETVTGKEVTLSDYIDGTYRDPNRAKPIDSIASEKLTFDLASRRYSSFVDLNLSSQLSNLPESNPGRTSVIFARDLRPSDANSSNLILLGSRQANPWVSLIEPSMNFVLAPDGRRGFYFVNRHPRKGELNEYIPKEALGGLGAALVYGDVTYLPNPNGQGMVLSLGGLWMTGTQSAGNFVLDGPLFSKWLKSIANADGTIPPFELLIGTKNLQGSATDSSIIAERVAGR